MLNGSIDEDIAADLILNDLEINEEEVDFSPQPQPITASDAV